MESGTMAERRKKTIKTRDRVVNAVFPGLDVVVDCGGNFRQTGFARLVFFDHHFWLPV